MEMVKLALRIRNGGGLILLAGVEPPSPVTIAVFLFKLLLMRYQLKAVMWCLAVVPAL